MHIYPWQMSPQIDHRSLEHHYTKSVSHIEGTYTHGRCTPQLTIHCWNTTSTESVSHIEECTYTHGRCTSLQSTIHLWNTTTPNKFHIIAEYTYIPGKNGDFTFILTIELILDHHWQWQISQFLLYRSSYWQIYPWQMVTPSIDHRPAGTPLHQISFTYRR